MAGGGIDRSRAAAVVVALALQAGCGASGGGDGGTIDGRGDRAGGGRDGAPDQRDTALDAPADLPAALDGFAADVPVESDAEANSDARADAAEAAPGDGTDVRAGCGVGDGLWSTVSFQTGEYPTASMWSTGPASLFFLAGGGLRRWNGSKGVAFPVQPPSFPVQPPSRNWEIIRGASENDLWLSGTWVLNREDANDRLTVGATHWDGVGWKDLTLVIPVSPAIPNPDPSTFVSYGSVAAFWPVGPEEAWQWVSLSYPGLSSPPPSRFVAYHLEGGTWTAAPSPLDTLQVRATPMAAWGSARNDVWVGGSVAREVAPSGDASAPTTAEDPLLLHWNGSTWTRVELPISPGSGLRGVRGLWGTGANDVWAVGRTDASGDTWHFDGDRWTEMPVAAAKAFDKVWGTCPGDYWAVGSSEPRPWRFDGNAWSAVTLPAGVLAKGAVTGSGPGDVWVSVQKPATCTPYEVERAPGAAHWGRNRCGDGVVAGTETCDPPRSSGDGLRCDQACQRPLCGNGVVDPGEECDPPTQVACDETCHRRVAAPVCGNGIREANEQCDFADPKQTLCKADCTSVCFTNCLLTHQSAVKGNCKTAPCGAFLGADNGRCLSLLACMMGNHCAHFNPSSAGAVNTTCFDGPGPCVAQGRALLASVQPDLDTTDPQVLYAQAGYGGILYMITAVAAGTENTPTTSCIGQCR